MKSDRELLREYGESRSEAAFNEFVRRNIDLVYTAAKRMVRQPDMAEDVTQAVFMAVAKRARELGGHPVLSGWLHQTTRNLAVNVVREEARRRARESELGALNMERDENARWEEVEPHLDSALTALKDEDRNLILLRYFQRKTAREIADDLNLTEAAAQKRLGRAVERLRQVFGSEGVFVPPGFGSLLNQAVQSAPGMLAEGVARTVVQKMAGAAFEAVNVAPLTAAHKAVMVASLTGAVGLAVIEMQVVGNQGKEIGRLTENVAALRGEADLLTANRTLHSGQVAALESDHERLVWEAEEASKLREEIQGLRENALRLVSVKPSVPLTEENASDEALKGWLGRVDELKGLEAAYPSRAIPEIRLLTEEEWLELAKSAHKSPDQEATEEMVARQKLKSIRAVAKKKLGFRMSKALESYREAQGNVLPKELAELAPYFETPIDLDILNRYEMVRGGRYDDVPDRDAIIIGEKAPVDETYETRLVIGKQWLQLADKNFGPYWGKDQGAAGLAGATP